MNADSKNPIFNPQMFRILNLQCTEFPESPVGLLFGRGAIDFIKKTCAAHYRMMTASWEVNKKSIWNYITASTGWVKASHHVLLPTQTGKWNKDFSCSNFMWEWNLVIVLKPNQHTKLIWSCRTRKHLSRVPTCWRVIKWRNLQKNVMHSKPVSPQSTAPTAKLDFNEETVKHH